MMKRVFWAAWWAAALLLTACAGAPPAPDWQANAFAAVKGFTAAYLDGNTRLAEVEWGRATTEVARTGRLDLVAHLELTRCAVRAASLEFDHCASYQPLAQDASTADQAYAAYLNGQWGALEVALLPVQHRTVVAGALQGAQPAAGALSAIEDPLARLVAAGALLQSGHLTPPAIAVAVDTASSQGWRRPLLAWLGVQLQRADAAGDREGAARIQRRLDVVLPSSPKTP